MKPNLDDDDASIAGVHEDTGVLRLAAGRLFILFFVLEFYFANLFAPLITSSRLLRCIIVEIHHQDLVNNFAYTIFDALIKANNVKCYEPRVTLQDIPSHEDLLEILRRVVLYI